MEDIFINALNTHAPVKTKIIRANNHEFMTKALPKAIMARSIMYVVIFKLSSVFGKFNIEITNDFIFQRRFIA